MVLKCEKSILLVILVLISTISNGQTSFTEHSIAIDVDQDFWEVAGFYASDLDNDGDIDIIYTESYLGGVTHINWLENIDGQGSFIDHFSFESPVSIQFIITADIDNDNDEDLLVSTWGGSKLIIYKNIDGQANFGEAQVFEQDSGLATTIHPIDIDGDGDIDLVVPSLFKDELNLYKNVNGEGVYSRQTVSINNDAPYAVFSGDIDLDGDIDILCASSSDGKISWHENIGGLGNSWTEHEIAAISPFTRSVSAADLDNDGDLDVISGISNNLVYFENYAGGSYNANPIHIFNQEASFSWVTTFDKDNDEKIDVLSASYTDNKIAWYKNEGVCCEDQQIVTTNANHAENVCTADINMDGRTDLISVSREEGIIFWHENMDYLGVVENHSLDFKVFPNPSDGFVEIKSDFTIHQIDLYNIFGQLEVSIEGQNVIDVSSFSSGFYILKITDLDGITGFSKILKN